MRYIKRNGLYIIIVCVLLLVVGAVIAVVGQVKRLSPAKQEEPSPVSYTHLDVYKRQPLLTA